MIAMSKRDLDKYLKDINVKAMRKSRGIRSFDLFYHKVNIDNGSNGLYLCYLHGYMVGVCKEAQLSSLDECNLASWRTKKIYF